MLKAILTGFGLFAGTLLYSLIISGAGDFRLDWTRAIFVGTIGFLVHGLYLLITSRRSGTRPH